MVRVVCDASRVGLVCVPAGVSVLVGSGVWHARDHCYATFRSLGDGLVPRHRFAVLLTLVQLMEQKRKEEAARRRKEEAERERRRKGPRGIEDKSIVELRDEESHEAALKELVKPSTASVQRRATQYNLVRDAAALKEPARRSQPQQCAN